MERCRLGLALVLLLGCCGFAGCSGSASNKDQAAKGKGEPEGPTPAVAVHDFLEAVRTGNDAKANAMLTEKARHEVESQVTGGFTPRASDTAKYEVGEYEYTTEEKDVSHVASKWTDIIDGKSQTYEYLWGMRKETAGWRVAGVVFKVFDDELPLVLNFEDGKEMVEKLRLTAEEMQRRATEAEKVATKPAEPVQK